MLLCVFLVWPTEFANTLSFYAKQIWCLRIYGECLKILILGKLGLKLLFLKNISSHTHAFCSSISMLWDVSKLCFVFFKKLCFLKKKKKNCEPLSVSIDRVCFSINRNCFLKIKGAPVCFNQSKLIFDQSKILNQIFLKLSLTCSNSLFKSFSNFSLSLRIGQGLPSIFCHFPLFFL